MTSANLEVNFVSRLVQANLSVFLPALALNYAVSGQNLPIVGSGFSSAGGVTTVTPTFVPGPGPAPCAAGCSATIDGFFAGANAARAGLAYSIVDGTTERQTVGAAALRRAGF